MNSFVAPWPINIIDGWNILVGSDKEKIWEVAISEAVDGMITA